MWIIRVEHSLQPKEGLCPYASKDLELLQAQFEEIVDGFTLTGRHTRVNRYTVSVQLPGNEHYFIRVCKINERDLPEGVMILPSKAVQAKIDKRTALKGSVSPTAPKACLCECGGQTKGGRFLPGHDMKLKGSLIKAANTGTAAQKTKAVRRLKELGWEAYVPIEG